MRRRGTGGELLVAASLARVETVEPIANSHTSKPSWIAARMAARRGLRRAQLRPGLLTVWAQHRHKVITASKATACWPARPNWRQQRSQRHH